MDAARKKVADGSSLCSRSELCWLVSSSLVQCSTSRHRGSRKQQRTRWTARIVISILSTKLDRLLNCSLRILLSSLLPHRSQIDLLLMHRLLLWPRPTAPNRISPRYLKIPYPLVKQPFHNRQKIVLSWHWSRLPSILHRGFLRIHRLMWWTLSRQHLWVKTQLPIINSSKVKSQQHSITWNIVSSTMFFFAHHCAVFLKVGPHECVQIFERMNRRSIFWAKYTTEKKVRLSSHLPFRWKLFVLHDDLSLMYLRTYRHQN